MSDPYIAHYTAYRPVSAGTAPLDRLSFTFSDSRFVGALSEEAQVRIARTYADALFHDYGSPQLVRILPDEPEGPARVRSRTLRALRLLIRGDYAVMEAMVKHLEAHPAKAVAWKVGTGEHSFPAAFAAATGITVHYASLRTTMIDWTALCNMSEWYPFEVLPLAYGLMNVMRVERETTNLPRG